MTYRTAPPRPAWDVGRAAPATVGREKAQKHQMKVDPDDRAPRAAAAASALPLAGARVLVVEDNAINQQVARQILESFGLAVEVASNGQMAIAALTEGQQRFDAVLMDVQMPEMDGCEATRIIRARLSDKALPIIAMTAHVLEVEQQACLEAGMNDHFAKPINPARLLATLTRWIKPRLVVAAEASMVTSPAPARLAKRETSPDFRETLPGVDMASALARLSGDRAFLFELLHQFSHIWSGGLERLRDALAQGDAELAHRLAHTLRGSALTLSMPAVAAAAGDVEKAIEAADQARTMAGLEALEKALTPVLAGLAALPAPGAVAATR
jgi:two-component system sensor histidine kinase/response regulator